MSRAPGPRPDYSHMAVIEPGEDLELFARDHAALLAETEVGAVVPTYRITGALREMLSLGPVAAVRRGRDVALVPRAPGPGGVARIIPLDDRKEPRSVALTAELARRLQAHIDAGDLASAHALLQRGFDGAAAPGAASAEPALTFENAREALWTALSLKKYDEAV